MDFVKKHWEKILLTAALLALILMGVWLMLQIDQIQQQVNQIPLRRPKGKVIAVIEKGSYTNAIARMQNPIIWDSTGFPFGQDVIESAPPVIPVSDEPRTNTLSLISVVRVPFKMLFKAYTWNGREAANFQLNFAFRSLTFIVTKIGDEVANRYENSGYFVTDFVREIKEVDDPNVGKTDKDVSILTLKRQDDDPIKLTLGKPGEEKEPVATLACDAGWPAKPVRYQVRRGQRFECAGTPYIVVDITPKQVIIKNANKPEEKPITIELQTSPEPASP